MRDPELRQDMVRMEANLQNLTNEFTAFRAEHRAKPLAIRVVSDEAIQRRDALATVKGKTDAEVLASLKDPNTRDRLLLSLVRGAKA